MKDSRRLVAAPKVAATLVMAALAASMGVLARAEHGTADLQAFMQVWRAALVQPGGEAIADLSLLPFLFQGGRLQRPAFVARAVPALFTPTMRRCLQKAEPVADQGRMVLICHKQGFVLARTVDGWRLIEFFADPEA